MKVFMIRLVIGLLTFIIGVKAAVVFRALLPQKRPAVSAPAPALSPLPPLPARPCGGGAKADFDRLPSLPPPAIQSPQTPRVVRIEDGSVGPVEIRAEPRRQR